MNNINVIVIFIFIFAMPLNALADDIPVDVFKYHAMDNWKWTGFSLSNSNNHPLEDKNQPPSKKVTNNNEYYKNVLLNWEKTGYSSFYLPIKDAEKAFIDKNLNWDDTFELALKAYKSIDGWEDPYRQFQENSKTGREVSFLAAKNVDYLFLFRIKAILGDAESQFVVGKKYAEDSTKYMASVKWYELAVAQGHKSAQNALGEMFENGKGVPINLEEAINFYKLSANQNFNPALFNLGRLYENGVGVNKSIPDAIKYYRIAASQSHIPSKRAVAEIYKNNLYDKSLMTDQDKIYFEQYGEKVQLDGGGYDEASYKQEQELKAQKAREENERAVKENYINNQNLGNSSKVQTNDFANAKKQCADLGFKTGTEKFGKCVLELTK